MGAQIEEIRKVFSAIKQEHHEKIHKLEQSLFKNPFSTQSCLAYFTNTLSIAPNRDEEHIIIGKFHLVNSGHTPIQQPIIFFTLKSEISVSFSGKFAPIETKEASGLYEWERVKTEGDPKKEYCFKPLKVTTLAPGQSIVFSDFQLKFPQVEQKGISLDAFVYYKELPDGVKALNSISLTM